MALVFEILLGVMILASFFVAYMSAKTWNVLQVVVVAFVFLGSVVFFYLAARTLVTHNAWRTLVQKQQVELDGLHKQTQQLNDGGPIDDKGQHDPKGIRQLREDLHKLTINRGGVLFDVAVEGVKDGVVQLTLKSADHGLVANSVLFAFDQTPFEEGGRYQGEFKVAAIGETATAVQIAPNLPFSQAQMQRLAAAKGPWTLYTEMPIDDPAVFARLDDAARTALLPAASAAEFAQENRKLRDYNQFFHESYVQQALLADSVSKLASNIERTETASKEAATEIAYRETEKTNLQADLEKFQYERKAIAAYQTTLEKLVAQLRDSLKATYLANRTQAAALTATQLKAADEINRRTEEAEARAELNATPAKP